MKIATQIRFLRNLNKLAKEADRLELVLPNGGEVGSLLGSMADDLQIMWEVPQVCVETAPKEPTPTINQHPLYEECKRFCTNCRSTSTRHFDGSREYEVRLKCTDCNHVFTLTEAATTEIFRREHPGLGTCKTHKTPHSQIRACQDFVLN